MHEVGDVVARRHSALGGLSSKSASSDGREDRTAHFRRTDACVQVLVRGVMWSIQQFEARFEADLPGVRGVVRPNLRAWLVESKLHEALDVCIKPKDGLDATVAHRVREVGRLGVHHEVDQRGTLFTRAGVRDCSFGLGGDARVEGQELVD